MIFTYIFRSLLCSGAAKNACQSTAITFVYKRFPLTSPFIARCFLSQILFFEISRHCCKRRFAVAEILEPTFLRLQSCRVQSHSNLLFFQLADEFQHSLMLLTRRNIFINEIGLLRKCMCWMTSQILMKCS